MPFEPRLVSPDDGQPDDGQPDDGQVNDGQDDELTLDLPADLAALANQLRTDADRLAARYPADWHDAVRGGDLAFPASSARTRGAGGSHAALWSAAVAAAAVLVLGAWGVWRLATSGDSGDRPLASHAEVDELPSPKNEPDSIADTAEAKPVVPALPLEGAQTLLMHVNGPELEGVLDLMESQPKEAPLLSI